jgi:hypothetical protein
MQIPILDLIPDPKVIRRRLSDLAAEADFLRALLHLLERRECGRWALQRRIGGIAKKENAHVN